VSRPWVRWHRQYGQYRTGALAKRLKVVQRLLGEALDRAPEGRIRVLSLCSGDGRDLLGVLPGHPRAKDVTARLIDLEPTLLAAGRQEAAQGGWSKVKFVRADASRPRSARGAVPANVVLACGIFGNISRADIHRMIRVLPSLCAPSATVLWTRGRTKPDATPQIRAWFVAAGFEEIEFVPIPRTTASVGSHRLIRAPRAYDPKLRLWTEFGPPHIGASGWNEPPRASPTPAPRRKAPAPRRSSSRTRKVRTKGG
jgi:hypothetical protein